MSCQAGLPTVSGTTLRVQMIAKVTAAFECFVNASSRKGRVLKYKPLNIMVFVSFERSSDLTTEMLANYHPVSYLGLFKGQICYSKSTFWPVPPSTHFSLIEHMGQTHESKTW